MNPIGFISEHKKETIVCVGILVIGGVAIWKGPILYREFKTKRSLHEKVRKVKKEGPHPEEFMASLNEFHKTLNTDKSKDDDSVYTGPRVMPPASGVKAEATLEVTIDDSMLDVFEQNAKQFMADLEAEAKEEAEKAAALALENKTPPPPEEEVVLGEDGYPEFYGQTTLAEALKELRIKRGEEWDHDTEEGRAAYEAHLQTLHPFVRRAIEDPKLQERIDELVRALDEEAAKWVTVPEDQSHIAEHQWILQKLAAQEELYDRFELPEEERVLRREGIIKSLGEDVWERWINWKDPVPEKKPAAKKATSSKKSTPAKDVK